MRYIYPFYREEKEDERQVGFILPFIGGAVLGGLVAPAFINKNPGYYPYNPGYYNSPVYPSYYYEPNYNIYPPYSTY